MNTTSHPIIKEVLNLTTFSPSDNVNRVMSSLVQDVIASSSKAVDSLASPDQVMKVRQVSAKTESELEMFWARLIISSANPRETLDTFPYLKNYSELASREIGLLNQSGFPLTSSSNAVIIGSGPLPLSALELYYQTGVTVDHVDSSGDAIDLCKRVTEKLGVSTRYYESPGETVLLEGSYDLILIAALAGDTAEDKQRIIDTVIPHLAEGGRVLVRSAQGSRELLYPAIHSSDLRGVRLLEEYHPDDYIINSVFIYGK